MTAYVGVNFGTVKREIVVDENGEIKALPWRLDLANHSPTGFAWGYLGSGPAQAALAILAHAAGDAVALQNYQAFKAGVIARIPQDQDWRIDKAMVMQWLRGQPSREVWSVLKKPLGSADYSINQPLVLTGLEDAQDLAGRFTRTFEAPTPADLASIAAGYSVKVCRAEERFWIAVEAVDGDKITGTIDNDLVLPANAGLRFMQMVIVEKRHVYQVRA